MTGPKPIGVELIQDISALSSPVRGYLRRLRHRVKTVMSDGSRSDTYIHDLVDREAGRRDSVAIAVFAMRGARPQVLLREQFRYGAYVATGVTSTFELVAGVLDPGETPAQAAARELAEETGIDADPSAMTPLGPEFFALPSILTERVFPFAAEVTPELLERVLRVVPRGDGSPVEDAAQLLALPLSEALAWTARATPPRIADARTELILARLAQAIDNQPA